MLIITPQAISLNNPIPTYTHICIYNASLDIEVMECLHRPINVRRSVIKTANLGMKFKPSDDVIPTSSDVTMTTSSELMIATTEGEDHDNIVTMDTAIKESSSEATVTMETSDELTKKGLTGSHGNTTTRTQTDNSELSYAGSVTITTAQPANNIIGHTGYLTFATLGPTITTPPH